MGTKSGTTQQVKFISFDFVFLISSPSESVLLLIFVLNDFTGNCVIQSLKWVCR